ncbi:hypothetical protein P4123_02570 [Pseudomonas aeruginosa]|nr:hypothetical protein [Pseudomonas aeruginosa]
MTFMTNDYLEYYLTLLGWIINNGIWNMISDTGLFAVPFAAIVMREWLKVRGGRRRRGQQGRAVSGPHRDAHLRRLHRGRPGGDPGRQRELRHHRVRPDSRQQCQYNLPAPADTGWSSSFSSLAGKCAQMPLWWAMMHALSKGFTSGAIAAIPCGIGSAADANGSGQHAREQPAAGTRNR